MCKERTSQPRLNNELRIKQQSKNKHMCLTLASPLNQSGAKDSEDAFKKAVLAGTHDIICSLLRWQCHNQRLLQSHTAIPTFTSFHRNVYVWALWNSIKFLQSSPNFPSVTWFQMVFGKNPTSQTKRVHNISHNLTQVTGIDCADSIVGWWSPHHQCYRCTTLWKKSKLYHMSKVVAQSCVKHQATQMP